MRMPACPECSGTERHESSCRGAAALDELMDRDRAFFEQHPGTYSYYRRPEPADFGLSSLDGTLGGKVRVIQHAPGVRSRDFSGVYILPNSPDSVSLLYLLQIAERAPLDGDAA